MRRKGKAVRLDAGARRDDGVAEQKAVMLGVHDKDVYFEPDQVPAPAASAPAYATAVASTRTPCIARRLPLPCERSAATAASASSIWRQIAIATFRCTTAPASGSSLSRIQER